MQDIADVLVIGSGAAGAALTWRLTELGAKVVCLEQGGWIDPTSLPSAKPDYETQLIRGDFNFDPIFVSDEKITRYSKQESTHYPLICSML